MFWTMYASGLILSTEGLTTAERQGLVEFQGDGSGCETYGRGTCGRPCGHGHEAS